MACVLAASILTLSADPASALFHGSTAPCAEPARVSDQQLEDLVAVLNASFSGATGGASSRFVFELSSVDRTI
jgi:hypothetical protein